MRLRGFESLSLRLLTNEYQNTSYGEVPEWLIGAAC
jgi:hypothetical protein